MTPRERAIEALFGEFLDGDDIACGERDGFPAAQRARAPAGDQRRETA